MRFLYEIELETEEQKGTAMIKPFRSSRLRVITGVRYLILALFFVYSSASAAPIVLQETVHFCDDRSPNSIGFGAGRRLTFAANFTPDGDLDGDGFADSDGISLPSTVVASQDGMVIALNFLPTVADPNHFVRSVPFDCDNPTVPDLRDSWSVVIVNGPSTLTTTTPNVQGVQHINFVKSMWLSGSGTTPTFNWTYPTGSAHDRVRISVRDLADFIGQGGIGGGGSAREIFAQNLPSTVTSFPMPSGELLPNHLYSVAIQLDSLRPPQPFPFDRLQSRSRSFFDFSTEILNVPGNAPVFLPIVNPTGSPTGGTIYKFGIDNITPGQTVFVDPAVAIGYDYQVGSGDPNFKSVLLPQVGNNLFDLYLWNGSKFAFHATVGAGSEYVFPSGGVDRFRVLGIEVGAGLDPNNATAFITGLTFVSAGQFTGTMTPIIAEALCSNLGDDPKPSLLDQDIYTLQGARGEELRVRLEDLKNANNKSASLILLDNIQGSVLLKTDNGTLPNEVSAVLPATGEYLVVVAEQPLIARGNRFRGDYCLSVQSSAGAAQTLQPTGWVEP